MEERKETSSTALCTLSFKGLGSLFLKKKSLFMLIWCSINISYC